MQQHRANNGSAAFAFHGVLQFCLFLIFMRFLHTFKTDPGQVP